MRTCWPFKKSLHFKYKCIGFSNLSLFVSGQFWEHDVLKNKRFCLRNKNPVLTVYTECESLLYETTQKLPVYCDRLTKFLKNVFTCLFFKKYHEIYMRFADTNGVHSTSCFYTRWYKMLTIHWDLRTEYFYGHFDEVFFQEI